MAAENNNQVVVPEHQSTEKAFDKIDRANSFISIITIVALVIMVVLLSIALIRVNQIAETQQAEAAERSKANRELLEGLTKSSRDTQVLICSIVTVQVPSREPNPDVTRVCGPVLADPENKDQGFLTPGSNQPAPITPSQPAAGGAKPPFNQNQQPNNSPNGQPPKQTPAPQPGLVDELQQTTNPLLCNAQQLAANGCRIGL